MSREQRAGRYEQALSGQLAASGAVAQPLIRSRGGGNTGPDSEPQSTVIWNVAKLTQSVVSVYDAPLSGLSHISQVLGKGPLACGTPFVRILLLGPHDCVVPFVEWYFAKSLPTVPPNHWVAVVAGPDTKIFSGEDALQRFPQFKDVRLHDNLSANFHVCALSGGAARSSDGVEFIIPPRIEGVVNSRHAAHAELINQLRAVLYVPSSFFQCFFVTF